MIQSKYVFLIIIIIILFLSVFWGDRTKYEFTLPNHELPDCPDWTVYKSKGEEMTCKAFSYLLGREIRTNVRDLGLRNPETNRELEIDCYDPVTKIGVEYNGAQHYEFTSKFHKTYEDFENQQRRDNYKHEQAEKLGIYLITIPYTVDKGLKEKDRFKAIYGYLAHELQ